MRRLIFALIMCLPMTAAAVEPGDSLDHKLMFVWGAEAGSDVDMSGHDMSSFDFNAAFGIRRGFLKFLGVGAGANIMISNSCRTYPLFAVIRTDFSARPKLLFVDARVGAALNYLPNNVSQTDAYASLCLGINLATGERFRSYILAGYTFIGRRDHTVGEVVTHYGDLHQATIRLGVSF